MFPYDSRLAYDSPVTHDVVQYRVDRRWYVVQPACYIEQVFVDRVIVSGRSSVDEEQALEVEWRPADEERYHHCRWKKSES